MENFTKEDRLAIYKAALKYINDDIKINGSYQSGLCHALKHVIFSYHPNPYYHLKEYKELYKHKPHHTKAYWWERNKRGDNKRIEVLQSVISCMEI